MKRKYFKSKFPAKEILPTAPVPTEKEVKEGIRLNKLIANAGIAARRKADEFIRQGAVSVNDKVVTEMGHRVQPGDVVKYNGKVVTSVKFVYILLNKPKDFITTLDDEQDRKTVMELIKGATTERVYPVGRLDRKTTGLLLLTNDGELAHELTHPSRMVTKLYEVSLNFPVTEEDMLKIANGVELEDGIAEVDEIDYADISDKRIVGVKLHSGKNRIVRRIFESLKYDVVRLDRVMYGPLTKKDLPRGRWRLLEEKEIIMLKHLGKKAHPKKKIIPKESTQEKSDD